MNGFQKLTLTAAIILMLATMLTTSCSSSDDNNDKHNSSSSAGIEVVYGDTVKYEGEKYPTVVIGNQTWFSKNLNYKVDGSRCYGEGGKARAMVKIEGSENSYTSAIVELTDEEVQANCDKYGRLYSWPAAMNLSSSCNLSTCSEQIEEKHQGICPSGWHIPSYEDWEELFLFINEKPLEFDNNSIVYSNIPGYLKSDIYGFCALPGGYYSDYFANNMDNVGFGDGGLDSQFPSGYWFRTEGYISLGFEYSSNAKVYVSEGIGAVDNLSIRCVKD